MSALLQVDPSVVADGVNYVWILTVTFLIFFMHAGFAMLEAGQVRSKNVAEIPADDVVDAIRESAHTGEKGDGKVFVLPVNNAVQIRTGKEGPDAV